MTTKPRRARSKDQSTAPPTIQLKIGLVSPVEPTEMQSTFSQVLEMATETKGSVFSAPPVRCSCSEARFRILNAYFSPVPSCRRYKACSDTAEREYVTNGGLELCQVLTIAPTTTTKGWPEYVPNKL